MPKILKDILSRVGYGGTEMEDDVQKLIEILRARLTTVRGMCLSGIYGKLTKLLFSKAYLYSYIISSLSK